MKSSSVSPMLVASVCVFIASIGCVLYAVAEPPGRIWNSKCVTATKPASCSGAGNAVCAAGASTCGYCYGATTTIPNKFCASWEGASCLVTGGAAVFCKNGMWIEARCNSGVCDVPFYFGAACGGDDGPNGTAHFPCSS